MTRPKWLPFAATILDGLVQGPDWKTWLRDELGKEHIRLAEDNTFHGRDHLGRDGLIGWYELVERDQARSRFGDAPWLSLDVVHPMIGKPIGFFCWDHIVDEDISMNSLVPRLIASGRGRIAPVR